MLEHVSRGQKLTTDLVNGIIDKANGQMIPSNGAFVNTQNGTLFINEEKSLSPNTPFITNTFLDCKIFKRAELESRPFTYKDITNSSDLKRQIFINFGNSVDTAKSLIQYNGKSVDEIILAGGTNQNLDYILDDEILTPANDSNNKLTLANDGFVNTAILFSNSVKIYGQIYKYFKEEPEEGEEVREPKFYFIVTDQSDVKQRVLNLTGDEESDGYILKKTYQTQLGLITRVGTNSNANKANYLINAKPITLVDDVNISSTGISTDIPPDTSLPDLHLSSVENYERDDGSLYRRLYNFDSEVEEFSKSDLSNNYDFIIRHTNDDGEKYIVYKSLSSLSGILSVANISGDSQVIEDEQKSITLCVDNDEKYYQLYNFDNGCANARLTSFYGADGQYEGETGNFDFNNVDILVRVRPNEDSNDATELQYLDFSTLSTITIPTDTEVFTEAEKDGNVEHTQKSIQICYGQFENGSQYKCLQLYKMDETSDVENEYKSVVIEHQGNDPDDREKPYTQSLLPEGYEFVVRSIVEGCQGGTIHYMPLSVGVVMPGVDTYDAEDRLSRSIEWTGCDSGKDYLRLYNFAWNYNVREYQPNYENEIQEDKFKLNDGDGILFRKSTVDDPENDSPELHYMTFKSLKNYINYEGDSNIVDDVDDEDKSESIERVYDEETHQEYFRLKDFKYRAGDIMLNGELESNSTTEFTDDDTHILVRQFDEYGHPVLKYAKLEISLPEINGGDDYSYEINELYEIVDYLSGEISAISGTCSCDLSGAWQQGADSEINYGSSIGDSYRYEAINLDNRILQGCWKHDGTFIIQGGDLLIPDGSINVGTVDSTYIGDGCIGVANINVRDSVYTQALTIGNTTITESQLQQLLALLN